MEWTPPEFVRGTAGCWRALALMVALSCVSGVDAAPPSSPVPHRVRSEITAEGRAVVVVQLAIDLPGTRGTPAASVDPRAAIREATLRLESDLAMTEATVRRSFRWIPCAVAELSSDAACDVLEALPYVRAVELDVRGHGALLESAPYIRAPEASSLGLTGEGTVVAVLDSGVDTGHPSFRGAIVHEYHFLDQGRNVGPGAEDDHGHGTNVTGIIASRGEDAPLGVAPGAQVVAIKVLDDTNAGWLSDWAAGVDHVITLKEQGTVSVDAINMSLVSDSSYPGVCDTEVVSFASACRAAFEHGIPIFAASGNQALIGSMGIPACYSSVVSVGSVLDTKPDRMSSFTNRNADLDLLAPGQRVTSTGIGGGTSSFQGTSQAAPHAAAVACLLREVDPTISPDAIRDVLVRTGRPFQDEGSGLEFPILDARAAVEGWLVPRVADLACSGLADRFVASWTPIAGIDRYFLQIRKDDQDAFSSYLQGQESGFEWTATGPGVYEVVLTPNDAAGLTGLVATCSAVVFPQRAFLRADCNGDGDVDISDPISLLGYLFLGASAVGCADACDANDDNALDISDGIQALNYMFLGGPAPAPPFGSCGEDPEGLMLGCPDSACP